MKQFPQNLTDRYGNSIFEDDVISDGEEYYRIYLNKTFGQVEAVGGPGGYLHNLSQKELDRFVRIGPFADNEELMEVD